MGRTFCICSVALILLGGCASGLPGLSEADGGSQNPNKDWSDTDRTIRGGDGYHAVWVIKYGPKDNSLWSRRMLATVNWYNEPSATRVERYRTLLPQLELRDGDSVRHLAVAVDMRYFDQLRFSPDGRQFVFPAADGICVFDVGDGTLQKILRSNEKTGYAISESSSSAAMLVKEDVDSEIDIFDIQSGQRLKQLTLKSERVSRMMFVAGDRQLAIVTSGRGSKKELLKLWNLESDSLSPSVEVPAWYWSSEISYDGTLYTAANDDNSMWLWSTKDGNVVATTSSHSGTVRCTAFSPDGQLLASGAEGEKRDEAVGEIKIWDATTGKEIATIIDDTSWGVTALAFSPDGTELASGNGDGHIRFWKVPDHYVPSVVAK
ncbi:MAG: hypothetical protein WEB58_04105 [Planctomycetaceae bacterium]